jgi:hypothetical protein
MYAGVPMSWPVRVRRVPSSSVRASPKSSTFTPPAGGSTMFSGLRSRCRIPFPCTWARASQMSRTIRSDRGTLSARLRASRAARVSPSAISITK